MPTGSPPPAAAWPNCPFALDGGQGAQANRREHVPGHQQQRGRHASALGDRRDQGLEVDGIQSAKLKRHDSYAYLLRLPTQPHSHIHELLPDHWQQATASLRWPPNATDSVKMYSPRAYRSSILTGRALGGGDLRRRQYARTPIFLHRSDPPTTSTES